MIMSATKSPRERVREMVGARLRANPETPTTMLYERAVEIDPLIEDEMTVRQFHGRFVLPVHRAMKEEREEEEVDKLRIPVSRTNGTDDTNGNGKRAKVRSMLLDYAEKVASAEGEHRGFTAARAVDAYTDAIIAHIRAG